MSFNIKVQVQLHAVYAAKWVHAPYKKQWRFRLCMHFADSVQYVIDDLVRENVPAYRCLWPLYVNFYKEEKKHILKLPKQKKWSPEARWVLLWFQNFRIDICFSRDFCRIRLLYVRYIISTPFWQNLKQFNCAGSNAFLFVFRDKKTS